MLKQKLNIFVIWKSILFPFRRKEVRIKTIMTELSQSHSIYTHPHWVGSEFIEKPINVY